MHVVLYGMSMLRAAGVDGGKICLSQGIACNYSVFRTWYVMTVRVIETYKEYCTEYMYGIG